MLTALPVRLGRVAFALAMVCASAAGAQTARDSARADSAAQRLKAVTITESRSAWVVGGAATVVVRPDQLRSSPAPSLEQALRESPFVHVRQNSRGEMELSVRGSDSRQAAVLLDGVPITLNWDHRTDPSLIPLTGAQSLVITRGLGSLLGGPNTLGGTIEVSHDNAFGRTSGSGRAWGGVGIDENAAYVASVGASRGLGNMLGGGLSLRAGLSGRHRDGFALPSGATDSTARNGLRTNSDLREIDGFASLRWADARGRALGVTVTALDAERGVPPEEHLTGPRLWRYPYNTRSITALSASSGAFSSPFGTATLEAGAGYNSGRYKIESYDTRHYQTVTAVELGDERTFTTRAVLSHSLPRDATLKVGVTTADVRYAETVAPAAAVDYRQTLYSGGAEVQLPVSGATSLASGLVYDRSATPLTGGRNPNQAAFDNIGWRAGLTHEATADWRLHASVSQRSRFPSLRELFSGALNRFVPNPDLKPETLLGVEAGFTVDRSWGSIPDGTIQVTAFHHNLDDAVVRLVLSNPTRFYRVNRDRIESTGAEMLTGFVFGSDRDRAVTITADATVQRIRLYDLTAGNAERHAENNPEVRGMVELGLPLPWTARGFLNARHTGKQYCLAGPGEIELGAKTEADVAVEKRFESIRVLVSLDNVGNTAVFDSCGLTQPGRTLRFGLTFR